MHENRRQILDMLAAGTITADEAERLMTALDVPAKQSDVRPPASPAPRYLRVQVEADEKGTGEITTKVNIRVPLLLLRAGVKLANLIPPQAREDVNAALRQRGIAFDINRLKPEDLDALVAQLRDLTIDVDQEPKKVRVRVFCE